MKIEHAAMSAAIAFSPDTKARCDAVQARAVALEKIES
jgi:hypothetical protein